MRYATPSFNKLDDCSQWFGAHWAIYYAFFCVEHCGYVVDLVVEA